MSKLLFIFLIGTTTATAQIYSGGEYQYTPYVVVRDTTQNAYDYYCIGNHPNCWGGVGKKLVGIDTLRIYKTYIDFNNRPVLINELKTYLTEPKGEDKRFKQLEK